MNPSSEREPECARWNFEASDAQLLVCRNLHDKGDDCDYQPLHPAEALQIINELRSRLLEHLARAALSTQPQQAGWMPISTAPKDGSRLILGDSERSFYGSWVSIPFQEYRDADGFYVGQVDPQDYWMDHESGDEVDPTHWQPCQPLPALPAPIHSLEGNQP